MGSFTFDAGDLVAGDPPKDVWLESKPSAKLPSITLDPFVSLVGCGVAHAGGCWRSGTGHKALKTMLS